MKTGIITNFNSILRIKIVKFYKIDDWVFRKMSSEYLNVCCSISKNIIWINSIYFRLFIIPTYF